MKPGIPWSVKGIEPDAREAAKQAARRSGMTLGEWLNSTIKDTADSKALSPKPAQVTRQRAQVDAPRSNHALERTASRLEDIAEHLSRLSRRETETATAYDMPVQRAENDTLHRVLSRVDSNERQTVEAFTAVNERLSILGRQIATSNKQRVESKPEDQQGYASLEKAVRSIVEHMETAEKRNRDNFKSLTERMSAMSAKAASAPQEQVLKQAPAFSLLENRLSELAKRVERSESDNAQNALPDLLKQELTELAGRIDTVRDTAESLANRAQTQAVQASQQELRAIEGRIVGLIREAQTSLTGNGAGPAEMQRLRNEVERLNARIDEAAQTQKIVQAQGGDMLALRNAVEQLSTRVAQGPDMQPIHEMDRRIVEITQRLEQTQAQTLAQNRNLPQVTEIERRLAELDHKLNEAMMGRSSSAAKEVETKLADIASRVDRTEQQLNSLETIERAVNQLFDSLEEQKTIAGQTAAQVAEGAATRAVQQMLAQQANQLPQEVSLAGTPEITALQQGLLAVKAASENSDQRNQETLEAVHETLEQIVSKLAELETAAIGQRLAAAMQPAQQPAQQLARQLAMAHDNGFAAQDFAAAEPPWSGSPQQQPGILDSQQVSMSTPVDVFAEPQMAPQDFSNTPQVPEFQVPEYQVPEMQAEPALAQEAPVNPFDNIINAQRAAMQANAAASGADDFIAAARRAAQASVQPKSLLSGISPGAAKMSEESSRKLLSFNLFKKKPNGQPKGPAPVLTQPGALSGQQLSTPPGFVPPAMAKGKAANSNEAKKRKLVLMGLALLAAVSVFTFSMFGKTQKAKPPAAPAAIEQSIEQPKADLGSAIPDVVEDAPAAEVTPPDTAAPPQPKPAELDSSLTPVESDPLLTGSLPSVGDQDDLGTLISADQQAEGATAKNMPPKEAGTLALREAAAQGNANAQFVIGTRYLNGELGTPQDFAKAAYWYGKSAAQGLAPAQYRLATLYERGKGVAKDVDAALGWYERAAGLGNIRSMHNAAVLSAGSESRAPDYQRAYKWFALGAAHGLKDSQFNLAVLLERGLGTKINPTEALFWYAAAAAQQDGDAAKRVTALAKTLKPAEVEFNKTRLKSWKPDTAPDQANEVTVTAKSWQNDDSAG